MSAVRLRIAGALALLACALVQAKIPGTDPPLPITVNTPPSLTNHSSKLIIIREKVQFELVCEGHSASKQGDEQAELEFLWKKDGVFYERDSWRVFQPDNAGTLTFTQAMEEDAGIYQCLVKNSLGTAVTQYTDVLYGHVGDFSPPVVKEHSVRNGDALHLKCDKIPVSIPPAQMMWSIISEPAGGGDKLEGLPQAVDEDKRIAYDEKGDMYFSYVTADDMAGGDGYGCTLYNKMLSTLKIGSQHKIRVLNAGSVIDNRRPTIQYRQEKVLGLRGDSATLTCVFSSYPASEVTWTKIGGELPAGRWSYKRRTHGRMLELRDLRLEDQGWYECEANNDVYEPTKDKVFLEVKASPYWINEPANQVSAVGETVEVVCEAGGEPKPQYSFFLNGAPIASKAGDFGSRYIISGDDQNTLILPDLKKDVDTAVYQCNATNEHGYIWTNFYVNVLSEPPIWLNKPKSRYDLVNTVDGEIQCETFAAPKAKVKWFRDRQEIPENNKYEILENGNLHIVNVAFLDKGMYKCTATNQFGSINATTQVVIRKKTTFITTPSDEKADAGHTVSFSCEADGDDEADIEIDWLKDAEKLDYDIVNRIDVDDGHTRLTVRDVVFADRGDYTCVATAYITLDDGTRGALDEITHVAQLTVQGPPDPPEGTYLHDCDVKTAVIMWQPGKANDSPIRRFHIQYQADFRPGEWQDVASTGDAVTLEYRVNVPPWGNYTFRVLAENDKGKSVPSEETDVCRTVAAPPRTNPTNVKGNGTDPNNLVISWTPMDRAEHNGPGFFYQLKYRKHDDDNPDGEWTVVNITDPDNSSLTVEPTDTYQPYDIEVMAFNDKGPATLPPIQMVGYSGEDKPTVVPQNFNVTAVLGPRTAEFVWDPVDGSVENIKGAFVGYKIKTWTEAEGPDSARTTQVKSDQTRATVENLKPYSDVVAVIVVWNGVYEGDDSEPQALFSTPEGPPGPVDRFEAYPYGPQKIVLHWQLPTEPNGVLEGYKISYQTVNGTQVGPLQMIDEVDDPQQTKNMLTDLDPDTKYRVTIQARTGAGLGDANYVETKTALEGIPSPPIVVVGEKNDTSVVIGWSQPEDGIPGSFFQVLYRKVGDDEWMETEEEYMEDHIVVAPLTPGTKYEMKVVAGNGDTDDLKTESVPQEVITEGDDSIATAGWFIGMMIAIAILILILIIVCLIKRNRGGKYPVQEKEAALGKDPEKGDEDGGFPEYNKPLTAEPDDTKGSRPSLNSLVKPMGSETDSMAEYGDGEGGKFNEDGSFIGLYGGEKKPRPAAGDQPAEQPSALSTFV